MDSTRDEAGRTRWPDEPEEIQRSDLVQLPLVRRQLGNMRSMTGLLVAYQQRAELTTRQLMDQLGVDEQGLVRLLLEERPQPDSTRRDIERMATRVGADQERLWELVQTVADLITAF